MPKNYIDILNDLQRDMYRFLNHLRDSRRSPTDFVTYVWHPNINICEGENKYIVSVEISGIDPKEVKIIVHGDNVYISGKRTFEMPGSGLRCLHMEIFSGPFRRTVNLPEHVNSQNVQAEFRDGFLRITLEKLPKETNVREIPISTIE